jgi:shikimate dehydrogenase
VTNGRGRLCASLGADTVQRTRELAAGLPPEVPLVELRADLLAAEEIPSASWEDLPRSDSREWVFTWRSPEEGGAAPRPAGVLARACAAGFAWVDVEARALEADDAEARAVPPGRRWVSRHLTAPPVSGEELEGAWLRLRRHQAALHKLVVPADRFAVNDLMLGLVRAATLAGSPPFALFAQGALGHPSRILGHLEGNAVTFVAPDDGVAVAAGQPRLSEALDVYGLVNLPPEPRIYGVLGNPARQSLSPHLHNAAFRRCGERALYIPLESPDPEPVLAWLRDGRLRGLSVTAPFKELLVEAAEEPDDDVLRVGAVNTLWWEDGRLRGANTDAEASFELLCELGAHAGDAVAVVGAGGAALAVLQAAGAAGLEATVFNRTERAGREAAHRFGAGWGGALEALDPAPYRVVVNATPLGLRAPLPPAWEQADWSDTAILDLAYGATPTAWARIAARTGSPFHDGLEFLVRQGVGQFRRWTRRSMTHEEFAGGLPR